MAKDQLTNITKYPIAMFNKNGNLELCKASSIENANTKQQT